MSRRFARLSPSGRAEHELAGRRLSPGEAISNAVGSRALSDNLALKVGEFQVGRGV